MHLAMNLRMIFSKKLSEVSIKEICKTAKERRVGSLGYAEVMLIYYSKRMKKAPSWKKLFENKKNRPTEVKSINENNIDSSESSNVHSEAVPTADDNMQVG